MRAPQKGDVGYDLYSSRSVDFYHSRGTRYIPVVAVHTDIYVAIPKGYVGKIFDRSSVALDKNLIVLAGVIDPSYRGELLIVFADISFGHKCTTNIELPIRTIPAKIKIAQMIVFGSGGLITSEPEIVDSIEDLGTTNRGNKGFGSTGR
jgi:dUTP pyrophosphatase